MGGGIIDDKKSSLPKNSLDVGPPSQILRALGIEKNNIEGAEIWIAEKFVGNAPATIKLPAGEYEVIVQKSGYKPWKRTIVATAGSLMNLTITLEKAP